LHASTRDGRGARPPLTAPHPSPLCSIDISPYKFYGPGGDGAPVGTIVVPCPDLFRGPHKRSDPDAGAKYAAEGPLAALAAGARPAAFIAESLPSVAGQIELPPGYLRAVYAGVRAAGGVCIADEVQTGFGRLGDDAFWGFMTHGVVPDIVTLGKPIGNGHPMGAVITTRAIADAFDDGMEYFCTGGGGPVATAAGRAVLAVLRDEALPRNAAVVGTHLKAALAALAARHAIIGDVRGRGLFLGVELVRADGAPATEEASYVCDRLRARGVLVGTEGPAHSVLKVRPPLCFSVRDADFFVAALDATLAEDGVRAPEPVPARAAGRGAILLGAAAVVALAAALAR
jgi:4-aminobutyrate aminotransferase-like enzyme